MPPTFDKTSSGASDSLKSEGGRSFESDYDAEMASHRQTGS
jgi:hypothetical protein